MESVELRHSVFKIGCTGTCGAQPTVVGRLCCCLCLSVLHCFCPTTECLAGDVRPEHPAAAGVDGIARLRRPPYEEPWGARNGSFDSAFSKAPASTFTSTSYLLRLLCPRLSFYFHLLFFFFDLDCR